MKYEIANSFCPKDKKEWRFWLEENHISQDFVWLIIHKKNSKTPTITWSEAVDEALCFGWIDAVKKSIDEERYIQYFCKRKSQSNWSKINKNKVALFIEQGLMTKAGLESIEIAKQNGSWTILDDVEELIISKDLDAAFKTKAGSKDYFLNLSKSVRKILLHWIVSAKRPETREKRIKEIVVNAHQKQKPKQFR
jgi:uncharacterized protein YdeI (YjbR/CyaY-like superfamily)